MKKRILIFLPALILTLVCAALISMALISGCVPSEPLPPPSARTVTDQAGRIVAIPGTVERIVSGYYISSSACIALGLADKLVGIEARAASRPIYKLAAPALLDLPNVGSSREFNMEGCIALEPDLVILPIRLRDNAEIMAGLGITVLLVNPESPGELSEMIALIGSAAGAEQRALSLIDYYRRSLDELRQLVSDIAEKPAVYMGGVGSYLTTAPRDMYQSLLIELAGGKNAAGNIEGSSRAVISYEQLLTMNPDVLIIPSEAGYTREDIRNDPQLANLSAVMRERIYQMPRSFEAWDSPVPSFALGIRWLLSVLHEDVYQMESMRNDVAAFYAQYYGIEIDARLIER
jgi:iron complex transport system substrate-binding protein